MVRAEVVSERMADELKTQIKQAIVRSLKLPIDPNEIEDAAPLFGAGLGLDSIDALELVLELERSFGVVVGDEQTGGQVLRSVDAIAEFVQAQRARAGT
jgi:acyl carrier protein